MKTLAFVAAVLTLTCACSSSTSDRPGASDEQRAAIERDREERAQARAEATGEALESDAPSEADARPVDVDRDQAAMGSAARERDPDNAARDERAEEPDEEADNTGRNERDDQPGRLTALDQSNSASDVDITQAIRKKVVADDALSFNAKNVKIITVSGKVTLRGPVASEGESKAIEKSARAVAGVVQVDNQIEVKR